MPLAPDDACFPEMLSDNYTSGWIGKWHLGDEIFRQRGFDEWVGIEDQYHSLYSEDRPDTAHSEYHEFLREQGYEPDMDDNGYQYFSREYVARTVPEEHSKPAFMIDEAIDFIERHRDEPFVLHLMFLEPHDPYTGPRDDQYSPRDVDLPPNFDHDGLGEQPLQYRIARDLIAQGATVRHPEVMETPPTEENWRRLISNYWGLVSFVDTHVGRLLDALSDRELADETITAFTSDHGDMMGSHQLYRKATQFEESVRVPLLIDFPESITGTDRVKWPVSQVDLVPTLLDALDQPIPDAVQGQTLLPALREGRKPDEQNVIIEGSGAIFHGTYGRQPATIPSGRRPGVTSATKDVLADWGIDEDEYMQMITEPKRTIVSPEGWKLTYRRSGVHELYDLDADPHETQNVAGDRPDIVEDLYDELATWQLRARDPLYL